MSYIKKQSKARFGSTQVNMIAATVAFCFAAANIAITQSIAAFNTIMLAVQSNLALINTLLQSISQPITGYADQKKAFKFALAQLSSDIMRAVYTYADIINDPVLAAKMRKSASDLMKMKDNDLVNFIQATINTVTPLLGSLADYNITNTMMTSWQTLCTALADIVVDPKNQVAARKAINEQIQTILRETMVIFYFRADQVAYQFKADNIVYYNNYRANRKLNPNHMSTQLRAHVTSDVTGQPVTNGEVFILGTDRSGVLDENGYCLIDHIPFGSHEVAVTTSHGSVTFGPFDFKKGHSLTEYFAVPWISAPATPKTTGTEEAPAKTPISNISPN